MHRRDFLKLTAAGGALLAADVGIGNAAAPKPLPPDAVGILYDSTLCIGCKGPETYNNCSTLTFGDVGASSWPVGMGAPCFGCSEQGVGYTVGLHTPSRIVGITAAAGTPGVDAEKGKGATVGAALVAGAAIGAVVGAGLATAKNVGKAEEGGK